MDLDSLTKLSRLLGIEDGYWDIKGQWHATPPSSSQTLIKILGRKQNADIQSGELQESSGQMSLAEEALARLEVHAKLQALTPVIVTEAGEGPFEIELRLADVVPEEPCSWCLSLEDGSEIRETINWSQCAIKERYTIPSHQISSHAVASQEHDLNMRLVIVPIRTLVPEGYHDLSFHLADESGGRTVTTRLIAVPRRCYLPETIQSGANVWGVGLQLYSLRSAVNWGIGDFGDVDELGKCLGEKGASFLGLNPLHALPIRGESSCSPYSPVSRVAFNYLYLSLPKELDFCESDMAQRYVSSTVCQSRLESLRDAELVDYQGVADLKLEVLEMMFQSFKEKHLSTKSPRAIEFEQYCWQNCKQKQETLYNFALYQALRESKIALDVTAWGWPVWEEWFQSPETEKVKQFACENQERITFFLYVQWLIEGQLDSLQAKLAEYGVENGLYLDLALGVRLDGSDVWANRKLYLEGVAVGAPPDDINELGQNWGLPPMNPEELMSSKYQLFIDTLRAAMRYSGMIRIDHVMQLYRLFLIPDGCDGKEGLYLRYPLHDLMGIIALESQRNKCVVIGEDLGTVPDEVVTEMRERGVLSYNLFLFSRRGDGSFKDPDEYQAEALVAASTHDLPTITGYWLGSELHLRQELGLYSREGELDEELRRRNRDRDFIKDVFQNLGLEDICFDEGCSAGMSIDMSIELKKRLVRNVNALLSKTPCYFQLVQLEDLVLQELQVNFPGTTDECPNWRRKIPATIEAICRDEFVDTVTQVLRRRSC